MLEVRIVYNCIGIPLAVMDMHKAMFAVIGSFVGAQCIAPGRKDSTGKS
jgi:hypothetical protein